MSDLNERWAEMLDAAMQKAENSGRSDVADYLRLRAGNDLVREAGVRWLLDSLIFLTTGREYAEFRVTAERVDPHSFAHHGSNIVGSLLEVRYGVRCLTLQAGWTRTPADGFMRGGALAVARLEHFGMSASSRGLMLVRSENGVVWIEESSSRPVFDGERLRKHFEIFLGI